MFYLPYFVFEFRFARLFLRSVIPGDMRDMRKAEYPEVDYFVYRRLLSLWAPCIWRRPD
jgi:hypothetical protein